jgi:hypothetical protein
MRALGLRGHLELSAEPSLAKLVSRLVLDEEGNEILDESVGQRIDLRVDDAGYGFGLGPLASSSTRSSCNRRFRTSTRESCWFSSAIQGLVPADSTMNLRRGAA